MSAPTDSAIADSAITEEAVSPTVVEGLEQSDSMVVVMETPEPETELSEQSTVTAAPVETSPGLSGAVGSSPGQSGAVGSSLGQAGTDSSESTTDSFPEPNSPQMDPLSLTQPQAPQTDPSRPLSLTPSQEATIERVQKMQSELSDLIEHKSGQETEGSESGGGGEGSESGGGGEGSESGGGGEGSESGGGGEGSESGGGGEGSESGGGGEGSESGGGGEGGVSKLDGEPNGDVETSPFRSKTCILPLPHIIIIYTCAHTHTQQVPLYIRCLK